MYDTFTTVKTLTGPQETFAWAAGRMRSKGLGWT